jgi:hypothetical protein
MPPSLNWDAPIPELGWKGKGKTAMDVFLFSRLFPTSYPSIGMEGKVRWMYFLAGLHRVLN